MIGQPGKMVLTVDDRNFKDNNLRGMLEKLKWLGIEWDEGPDTAHLN